MRTPPLPFDCSRRQVEERSQAIEGDYGVICDLYPPFRDVSTLEEFKWARMCVCSRNFGLDVGGLRTSALVPYADMLNHYRKAEGGRELHAGECLLVVGRVGG